MNGDIDDMRIESLKELSAPDAVLRELPRTQAVTQTVASSRAAIHDVLAGKDDRLVAVVGPCSIHDPAAAVEYAHKLAALRTRLADDLEIAMRVYFEKPRTTVGWKGLINDPDLDGTFHIEKGLRLARRLLLDINAIGLPAACEFLDMSTPQYIGDLVAWAAIGARTTESQIHRELASGLSCPVGFKNGTDGNVRIAIDAILSASQPHHFMAIAKNGRAAIAATKGNEDCHVILRGGKEPNYDAASVAQASAEIARAGVTPHLMIDASHANSRKRPENQPKVIADVAEQVAAGNRGIMGVMVESNLVAGRQDLATGAPLVYGQSVTDGCIDWATTVTALEALAVAARARRGASSAQPSAGVAKLAGQRESGALRQAQLTALSTE